MAFCNKIQRLLLTTLMIFGLNLTVSVVQAQDNTAPAMQGGMPGIPTFQQEELTLELAKAAIDSFLELKKNYGKEEMPDLNPAPGASAPQALQQYADFQNTVKRYGFSDMGQWHRSMLSLFLAHNFHSEGRLEEYERSVEQMKQSNMPEETMNQMIEMMNRLKPSKNNIAIAAALVDDPVYGPKLNKLQD